jgi:hypothetical protein
MVIAHPSIRAQTTCLCGCGEPPTGRSRYKAGHHAILSRCRSRLSQLKKYAKRESIPFALTLEDIRALIGHLPDRGDSVSFERHDLSLGFTRDNVLLRPHKGTGKRSEKIFPTQVVPAGPTLERMLMRVVERQLRLNFKGTPELTLEDVMRVYVDQNGRCRVSGVPLIFDKAVHPESLALTRRDPQGPWTKKNAALVTFALKPFIDRWGESYLVKVARRIAKHKDRKER